MVIGYSELVVHNTRGGVVSSFLGKVYYFNLFKSKGYLMLCSLAKNVLIIQKYIKRELSCFFNKKHIIII
jgi:hypothetical protein